MVLLIASFLMFHIEGDIQPDKFPNLLSCFWWAIATLTTVGYGDVVPITAGGKFLSGVIAVLGIGLVALPTGLIGAGFLEKIGKRKKEKNTCPHCGGEIEC
jgi:voltage-gated potassium channel